MKPKNIIIMSGLGLLLAFGGRALITNQDIPANLQLLVLAVLTSGLAADPLTEAAKRLGGKKPAEGEHE